MQVAPPPVSRFSSARSGFTWLELLIVFAIIGLLVALLFPARRNAGEAARRVQCRNHFKQIGLALHNYHDRYGSFPPPYTVDASGRKLHSWRTLILPYLDQGSLYEQLDLSKPWDDPANSVLRSARVTGYDCPTNTRGDSRTGYLAVVASDGVFRWGETTSLGQVTDGTAKTLLIVEVDRERTVPWMVPTDLDESTLRDYVQSPGTPHTGFLHTLMADGSVRATRLEELATDGRSLVSIAGGDNAE